MSWDGAHIAVKATRMFEEMDFVFSAAVTTRMGPQGGGSRRLLAMKRIMQHAELSTFQAFSAI